MIDMYVLKSDKTLFVDVDDTLVIWEGESYRPHKKHVELIKRFHKRNQPVVVWSAGGWEWAERIVKELGLEPYVTAIMSKPVWWIDDLKADGVLLEVNRIYLEE
jgi:hydroxymethylpyrimidine pyrophosphatase-like HAD family hydrolase